MKTGRSANKDAFAFLELNDGSTPTNLQARPCCGRRTAGATARAAPLPPGHAPHRRPAARQPRRR